MSPSPHPIKQSVHFKAVMIGVDEAGEFIWARQPYLLTKGPEGMSDKPYERKSK